MFLCMRSHLAGKKGVLSHAPEYELTLFYKMYHAKKEIDLFSFSYLVEEYCGIRRLFMVKMFKNNLLGIFD